MQFVYREWANYKKANGVPLAFGDSVLPAIEKMNVEKAKKIIVMSQVLKNEVLKNYKVPDEKVEVIYSGVNCDEFSPDNRKLYNSGIRKKLGIEENDIVLLFVGNPYNRKGLEYAVRALPLINEKRVKLLVMGKDLGDEKIANYQALAKKIGVGDKLVYGGFTNEIKKYFSVGDIFVFPTLYEPFGLVITEAMASGMPDVVSRCAGAAELIEDGKEGMLLDNPKNHKEIAEKINYLIDNNLFRKMGKAARAKAETFTWDRTTQQMLSVMEEAAEMKRRKIKY
ncbi:glycosyltransferase family 1 protein [archaeon]|nr:MAG: glycosyltransferase family 1 protein [archaeon]